MYTVECTGACTIYAYYAYYYTCMHGTTVHNMWQNIEIKKLLISTFFLHYLLLVSCMSVLLMHIVVNKLYNTLNA
jgi:hypothetical protein